MLSRSRLGLHIIQPAHVHVSEIERAAKAGVLLRMVKCVDFPGLIPEVMRVSPETVVMWRATGLDNPDGGEYLDSQNLDALAERLLAHQLSRLGSFANLAQKIILEVLNEPDPQSACTRLPHQNDQQASKIAVAGLGRRVWLVEHLQNDLLCQVRKTSQP